MPLLSNKNERRWVNWRVIAILKIAAKVALQLLSAHGMIAKLVTQ
nr:MAG TPA: hypothetical protein [Caudoviricetes sp.]